MIAWIIGLLIAGFAVLTIGGAFLVKWFLEDYSCIVDDIDL